MNPWMSILIVMLVGISVWLIMMINESKPKDPPADPPPKKELTEQERYENWVEYYNIKDTVTFDEWLEFMNDIGEYTKVGAIARLHLRVKELESHYAASIEKEILEELKKET